MAEKRNIILFGALVLLTLSYWVSASVLIGEKPFEIRVLEEEQQELNENLISAQILASQLDRVFTLFQENLALSKSDSLADDANLPFLNNLTDMLDELEIKLLGIKPKPRVDKITYFKAPYLITLECTFDQFGKFLSEVERSPRLITLDEFEVKNGIERIKANTEEEKLLTQEFVVNLSTITLVKSKSKVSS
ncbi:MAG: type 4a pilus biogenesis protein PilO [Candidatus Neomarinimicrobiota bacterium]|nr:type 4a pilus biogenesis protein PilO [Candidatus Neomarinimicrobiota bacterium]MEE3153823.1 type 4a pilus biogenesis protein PilO [Candidatus Neomarinimicrobiota bacterium]|tara:strand:- start:844 stop:1419 length:576 start_codon:yes stop_codon:yes gene_type:complete